MAERKSVSMQDLADKLGISKVTVSKALNGKDGVGEELKEKMISLGEKPFKGKQLYQWLHQKTEEQKSRYHHESAVQLRRRRKILYGNVRADHLRAAESILLEYHDFSDNSNTPVGHEHDTDQRAVRRPDLSWYSR